MGKIIRNGVEYSGACEDATAVNYNNSLSGLNAQTVQEGIDELSSSLGNLRFGYDEITKKYGYYKKEADTDVFVPFSTGINGTVLATNTVSNIAKKASSASLSYTATEDCFVLVMLTGYCHASAGSIGVSLSGGTTIISSGKKSNENGVWQSTLLKLTKGSTINMSVSAPADDWYRNRAVTYVAFK